MHYFMNTETYEQIGFDAEALGDMVGYLLPETLIQVEIFEGHPIGIEMAAVVDWASSRPSPSSRAPPSATSTSRPSSRPGSPSRSRPSSSKATASASIRPKGGTSNARSNHGPEAAPPGVPKAHERRVEIIRLRGACGPSIVCAAYSAPDDVASWPAVRSRPRRRQSRFTP